MKKKELQSILEHFDQTKHDLSIFMHGVHSWFERHEALTAPPLPIVHSVKSRIKNREHLEEKIKRKMVDGVITKENLFSRITDLAGVRVLHLYQDQFRVINQLIRDKLYIQKDWVLYEVPKAYTWDPESRDFFESLQIPVEIKASHYTSVHYVVRPREDSPFCCEIQVRTLFEEIWGEVDHSLNYPNPSEVLACQEQLKVLAKVVGAGSRLVDSIYRSSRI